MIQKRTVIYETVKIDRSELVPISAAAKMVGMTIQGIVNAIERGALQEYIDTDMHYHNRRMVKKDELLQWNEVHSKGKV